MFAGRRDAQPRDLSVRTLWLRGWLHDTRRLQESRKSGCLFPTARFFAVCTRSRSVSLRPKKAPNMRVGPDRAKIPSFQLPKLDSCLSVPAAAKA